MRRSGAVQVSESDKIRAVILRFHGYTLEAIGEAIGRDSATVSRALKYYEFRDEVERACRDIAIQWHVREFFE